MAVVNLGMIDWSGGEDTDRHRTYKIRWKIKGVRGQDGPQQSMRASGLPIPNVTTWQYGNESDDEAYCTPVITATPMLTDDPDNIIFIVENTFSTRPPERREGSCEDQEFKNPLTAPPKVSGGFVRYKTEETHDRFGNPLENSSHEQYRGPQVEFDDGHSIVRIEQNVSYLDLPLLCQMQDTLNALPLWGFPPRTIKLSDFTWERAWYGQCYPYYRRTTEFEIMFDFRRILAELGYNRQELITQLQAGNVTIAQQLGIPLESIVDIADRMASNLPRKSWDRYLLDEGTKVLNGRWSKEKGSEGGLDLDSEGNTIPPGTWLIQPLGKDALGDVVWPDPNNPAHFMKFHDRKGQPTRVILNGAGLPAGVTTFVEKYWFISHTDWAGTGFTYFGTCSGAAQFQRTTPDINGQLGNLLYGPFNTREDLDSGPLGDPVTTCETWTGPAFNRVERYDESDFLLLGIPVVHEFFY